MPLNDSTALVIDDHPLVARGIADYLRTHCGFDRVEAICLVADVWEYIRQEGPPTLVLVDFWLPGGTAIPLLAQLRETCPSSRLLVISGDDDAAIRDKVRQLAVDGFLLKQENPAVFAQAVHSVLQGTRWFFDASMPAQERKLPLSAADLGLSSRQGEVLALMLKGQPNKRIAQALSVSEQTIKEHVSSILDKLGVRNRIELIMLLRGKQIDV